MNIGDAATIITAVIAVLGVIGALVALLWRSSGKTTEMQRDISTLKSEGAALKESGAAAMRLIEVKHEAEVLRNDLITQSAKEEAKQASDDWKEAVQRLTALETTALSILRDFEDLWPRLRTVESQCTKVQTICEECVGRGGHCDEEAK